MVVYHVAGTARRGQDGVTRVLYEYLERHRAAGLSPAVVTAVSDPDEQQRFPMVELRAVRLPIYRDYRLFIGTRSSFARAVEHIGQEPDLVHIHTPCPLGRAAVNYARNRSIPVIATYHTHFPSYLRHHRVGIVRPFVERSLLSLYHRCDRVLIPSKRLLEELRNMGLHNLEYLPHGTDTVQFHPRWASHHWRQRLGIQPGQRVILYVGRLVWEKNLRVLIELWDRMDRRRYALVLVGTGPIEARLRRLMRGALFLGYRTGLELAEAYASSDVFVFPSDTETFGNVTLEALSSGLPCVVADSPGSSDLVRHGMTGFRVRADDVDGFVLAVEAIASLPPDSMLLWRLRARLDAERFQWSHICSKLFALYRSLGHQQRLQQVEEAKLQMVPLPQ